MDPADRFEMSAGNFFSKIEEPLFFWRFVL